MKEFKTYIVEKLRINKDFNGSHCKLYYIIKDWCEKNIKGKYEFDGEEYYKNINTDYLYLIIHGNYDNEELNDIAKKIENEIYLKEEGDIIALLDWDTKKIIVFNK